MIALEGFKDSLRALNRRGHDFRLIERVPLSDDVISFNYEDKVVGVLLTLATCYDANVRFAYADSEDPRELDQVEEALTRHVGVVPVDELKRRALKTMATDPKSLVRLAYGASREPDASVGEVIAVGFEHPDSSVRAAAVEAAYATLWTAWEVAFEKLARDPNPKVSQVAGRALVLLRQHLVKESEAGN
jgi:hypothetical protein